LNEFQKTYLNSNVWLAVKNIAVKILRSTETKTSTSKEKEKYGKYGLYLKILRIFRIFLFSVNGGPPIPNPALN